MRESCGLKVNTTLCRRKVLFCAGSSIELHDCLGSLLPRKRHLTHPIAGAGPRSSFKAKRRRKTETRHRSCAARDTSKLSTGPSFGAGCSHGRTSRGPVTWSLSTKLSPAITSVKKIQSGSKFVLAILKRLRTGTANLTSKSSVRSEEHTSELQSLRHLVCRLLLEK